MSDNKIALLQRALAREKLARKSAEKILEKKARKLHNTLEELKVSNNTLALLLDKKNFELKGVFRNIVDAYCVADMSGNILEMNEATFKLLGCEEKIDSLNLLNFVYKEDVPSAIHAFKQLKVHGVFKNLRIRVKTYNGIIKRLNINTSIVFNEKGEAIAMQGIARDVTKEYQLKKEILESEDRFKMLLENLDTGVLLEDQNRKIVLTNKKFCEIFSLSVTPTMLIGQNCAVSAEQVKDLFVNPKETVSQIDELITNKEEQIAQQIELKSGKTLQRDYVPIYINKVFKGHLWSFKDITTEKQAEEKLIESDRRFKLLLENLHNGVLLEDENRTILHSNNKACELLSIPMCAELLIGKNSSLLNDELKHKFIDPNEFISRTEDTLVNKKIVLGDLFFMKNGTVLARDYIPIITEGVYKGDLWNFKDVTEEKQVEQNLIESENNLKILVQNLDNGIYMEDAKGIAVLANKKYCEQFNVSMPPDLIPGEDVSKLAIKSKVLFQDPEGFYKRYKEVISNKKPVIKEEIRLADGKVLEWNYIPLFNNRIFKGQLWSFNDVTLTRRYKDNLEKEKQKYRNIIANTNIGMVEADLEGRILMVNQSFTKITGYNESELMGMVAREVLPVNKEYALERSKLAREGKETSYELELKTREGINKTILLSSAPNYNLKGEITGAISVILDVSELKQLERQKEELLKNLEKSNEELQEYAHIVSHDLKSPLRSLFALVSWLKEDNQNNLDQASLVNMALIESTLENMEQLITDILNYSSLTSDIVVVKPVDLNDVIDDLKQILYCPDHVTLVKKSNLPIVQGDRMRLQQVFQNLISNAIQYIDKEKGLIEIDCIENRTHYQFSVKDNGIGIEKSYHEKIFKIFNSLARSEKSTGIGLSIVKKIVDIYDGKVWLESTPGSGTTFYFTIKK